jgi:uncharacterized protein (DUF433 family)
MRNPTPGKRSLDNLISRDPRVHGGSPVIVGTPFRVADLIGCLRPGESAARMLEVLGGITTRQFEAAMTYYHSHFREIEAEIKEDQPAARP